jgi:hypothetical protein
VCILFVLVLLPSHAAPVPIRGEALKPGDWQRSPVETDSVCRLRNSFRKFRQRAGCDGIR